MEIAITTLLWIVAAAFLFSTAVLVIVLIRSDRREQTERKDMMKQLNHLRRKLKRLEKEENE